MNDRRCVLDRRSQLHIAWAEPTVEQSAEFRCRKRRLAQASDCLLPFLRNRKLRLQQFERLLIQAELQFVRVLQHSQHRQPIFVWPRRVQRVERIAENVRVPELAFDARRGVVRLLIRRRRQTRDEHVVIILLEIAGRIGQKGALWGQAVISD